MSSFLSSWPNKPWIIRCFILLIASQSSTAQGDPGRIPTSDERVGLIPLASFVGPPKCAYDCSDLGAAFASSNETWCTTTILWGSCVQTGDFIRMTTFCSALESAQCPLECMLPGEPRRLFSWVHKSCGEQLYDLGTWKDATVAKDEALLYKWIPALFPWNWTVQAFPQPPTLSTLGIRITDPATSSTPYLSIPPSGPGTCPSSTSEKLGVFAAVNIVSALLIPILGRRTVVHKLTFGVGGKLGSRGWALMGVLSACLNVCANVVNAHIIRSSPGYEDVPFGALALLWCTRPRLAWLAVFLAALESEDGMYFNCAASAITSEAILQVLGAVYFGITANYGREKGFYYIKHLDPYPRGVDAHIMYAGALLWLIMVLFTVAACLVTLVGLNEVIDNARKMMGEIQTIAGAGANAIGGQLQVKKWTPKWIRDRFIKGQIAPVSPPRKLTPQETMQIESVLAAVVVFMAFLAQWLFWAGFVRAAKERYCPPKLATIGAIWGLFSATGIFVGSAH